MKLAFKQPTEEQPKVLHTDFKSHYPSVTRNTAWQPFEAFIRQATESYILPFLGKSLYDDITDKIQTNSVPPELQEFVIMLKDVVAYYTMYHGMPFNSVIHSDFGTGEAESTDGAFRQVRQWRYNDTMWRTILTADQMMDRLLYYMEKNRSLSGDYFKRLWIDQDVYTENRDDVFGSTAILSKFININYSRRAYLRLIPHIKSAIRRYLNPMLCQDQMDRIINGIVVDDLSEIENKLLGKMRHTLANYALFLGIPHIRLIIDGSGISVSTTSDKVPVSGTITAGKSQATEDAIHNLSERTLGDAQTFMGDLKSFLYDNADEFPLWKNSSCCENEEDSWVIDPNDQVGGFFL